MSTTARMIDKDLGFHRFIVRVGTVMTLSFGGAGLLVLHTYATSLHCLGNTAGKFVLAALVLSVAAAVSGATCFTSFASRTGTDTQWDQKIRQLSRAMFLLAWFFFCLFVVTGGPFGFSPKFSPNGQLILAIDLIFLYFTLRHQTVVRLLQRLLVPSYAKRSLPRKRVPGNFTGMQLSIADCHCPVCGHDFTNEPPVFCGRCNTPHHRDCFEFTGHCSIFGCPGARSLRL